MAITVLQDLLRSEQDSVRLKTAKLILELGNYHSQNINLNVDKMSSKSDDELMQELQELLKTMPNLNPKLKNIEDIEDESIDIKPNELKDTKKRLIN